MCVRWTTKWESAEVREFPVKFRLLSPLVNAEERAAFVAAAGDGNPEIEHEVLSREDRPIRAKGVSRQGRDGAVCFCLAFLPILPTGFRRAGYCRKHC